MEFRLLNTKITVREKKADGTVTRRIIDPYEREVKRTKKREKEVSLLKKNDFSQFENLPSFVSIGKALSEIEERNLRTEGRQPCDKGRKYRKSWEKHPKKELLLNI